MCLDGFDITGVDELCQAVTEVTHSGEDEFLLDMSVSRASKQ